MLIERLYFGVGGVADEYNGIDLGASIPFATFDVYAHRCVGQCCKTASKLLNSVPACYKTNDSVQCNVTLFSYCIDSLRSRALAHFKSKS